MTALDKANFAKLKKLDNPAVEKIVNKYLKLCMPRKVTVITDSKEDQNYLRKLALTNQEETKLVLKGHTVHFDGYSDLGRDKEKTKVLINKNQFISQRINTGDRDSCLAEIFRLLDSIMKGKELLVCFYCLGPLNSKFSIPALQLTDSSYVAHSENFLYRPGYKEFKRLKGSPNFFHFIHASGELDDRLKSKNTDKKRIYIDLEENRVFSVNTQYAGNSVGLKKLALRLAIKKSHQENWLCEHMLVMGAKPKGKNRVTYFAGAFPSACGKTSTAMIPGQAIIGDDIAYFRPGEDGRAFAVNVEQGIFGIIEDVNPVDDPLIYKTLTTPRELIFSNILVNNSMPYWLGMGKKLPEEGINHSGVWKKGQTDKEGKPILPASKNARYTIRIQELDNADPKLDDPNGVPISGVIYGGRDSDTSPPVVQSFSWSHGVFMGACLESESTAATIGQIGIRNHNPMANLDFLVIPLGIYIKNHLLFGENLKKPPLIFLTNYFLKKNGVFLNRKVDKKVLLMWMEGRIHDEYDAVETPIGYIPKFTDLRSLFLEIFQKKYTKAEYDEQFTIRIPHLLERLNRIEKIYLEESDVPEVFQTQIHQQRERLNEAQRRFKKSIISPFEFG